MIIKSIKKMDSKKHALKAQLSDYFLLNPTTRLRVRQIERTVKVPLPSVIRYCKELEQEGVLKTTEIAGVKLFSADRTSSHYLLAKKLYNLKMLYTSGLVDHLRNEAGNPVIILFGSYAKGEDIESSDIDLYIENTAKINLKKYETLLHRNIQLFQYKNIKYIKNKDLANNIINGIVVNGFIEVFR